MNSTPPRGLEWTINAFGRVLALSLAIISLGASMYIGWRQVELVDCLKAQSDEAQRRTSAIASATDLERTADLALIKGGPNLEELRRDAIAARAYTDRVRAAHPAPPVKPCR